MRMLFRLAPPVHPKSQHGWEAPDRISVNVGSVKLSRPSLDSEERRLGIIGFDGAIRVRFHRFHRGSRDQQSEVSTYGRVVLRNRGGLSKPLLPK